MEESNSPYFREQVDDVVELGPQGREAIIVEDEVMSLRSYKKRRDWPGGASWNPNPSLR